MLHVPFEPMPIDVVSRASLTDAERIAYNFDLDTESVVDSRVFEIDSNHNYDFKGLFLSYRYWYPVRADIFRIFRFKKEILEPAASLVESIKSGAREVVSVHVRRKDYLEMRHLVNLSLDYYANAWSQFSGDQFVFLVFSDDIEWCKTAFNRRRNVVYAPQASQYVDMCAMSLCDHHIIANSSFSFWGALLNRNPAKRVVCPAKFLKEDAMRRYINYAWFPDDWICLEDLLA